MISTGDAGKYEKRLGDVRVRDARKIDASGTTPARSKVKEKKRFGYSYEWCFFGKRWRQGAEWFKTATARDQSLSRFPARLKECYRNVKAVER